jgi:hypothetical protein
VHVCPLPLPSYIICPVLLFIPSSYLSSSSFSLHICHSLSFISVLTFIPSSYNSSPYHPSSCLSSPPSLYIYLFSSLPSLCLLPYPYLSLRFFSLLLNNWRPFTPPSCTPLGRVKQGNRKTGSSNRSWKTGIHWSIFCKQFHPCVGSYQLVHRRNLAGKSTS